MASDPLRGFVLGLYQLGHNGTFHSKNAWTPAQYNKAAHSIDRDLVHDKSAWLIHPLDAPQFYIKAVDRRHAEIKLRGQVYRPAPKGFIEDKETGLRASVYRNADGHTILAFNGMAKSSRSRDTPYEDPRTVGKSINDIAAASEGLYGPQAQAALRLYKKVLEDNKTTKLQLMGYSLGSLYANALSAQFSQNAVTIANLGTDSRTVTEQQKKNIKNHVKDVYIGSDMYAGLAGKNYATRVDISGNSLPGFVHTPAEYAHAVAAYRQPQHQRDVGKVAREKAWMDRASAASG